MELEVRSCLQRDDAFCEQDLGILCIVQEFKKYNIVIVPIAVGTKLL